MLIFLIFLFDPVRFYTLQAEFLHSPFGGLSEFNFTAFGEF
jgi:hypothetical protein